MRLLIDQQYKMSSKRGGCRGAKRPGPLRKPGEFCEAENNISQEDEKPPVQKPEMTVNVASESGPKQFPEDLGTETKLENLTKETESQNVDNPLVRGLNNPVFIPKQFQQPAQTIDLASAVNAPEFVPGKAFFRREEERAEERLQVIEKFVNNKIKQLTEDPGLLDELSISMGNYLSDYIKVENDMIKLSDLLFEKCVSQQNFQYTGAKLANHLDKYLIPKTAEKIEFRTIFLKRCSSENSRFNDIIRANPERACNVAIFLGELLMNYKTKKDETINKFLDVVTNIINQLLLCSDRKLLICAGKLLKLTGSLLNENAELFERVNLLASDQNVDSTARMLFTRVCDLKKTSWGQNEIPQASAYTQPNPCSEQEDSAMYIPNMGGMLEEQASDSPVVADEEWNEYETDNSSQDGSLQDEDQLEELYRKMYLEQYGPYVQYPWSNGHDDDYDEELNAFISDSMQQK